MNQALANRNKPLLAPQLDYLLIDGSGSMAPKWGETILALDTYTDQLKSANLNAHLITSVFDSSNQSHIQRDEELRNSAPFRRQPLQAGWGGTPLFDAINTTGRHLKELNPPRATLLIVTDGDENGSKYTKLDQARAILNWCRAKGWQVIFFGCDFNNSNQARLLGANPETALGIQKALLRDATKNLANKRIAYGRFGTPINFTESEQQQFGGLLPKPGAC